VVTVDVVVLENWAAATAGPDAKLCMNTDAHGAVVSMHTHAHTHTHTHTYTHTHRHTGTQAQKHGTQKQMNGKTHT
jgi:hypothetical protein